jgi:hypothetical protein
MPTNMLPLPTESWWDDKLWGKVSDDPETWELRNAETGELRATAKQVTPKRWLVSMPGGEMEPCYVVSLFMAFEEVVYVVERREGAKDDQNRVGEGLWVL